MGASRRRGSGSVRSSAHSTIDAVIGMLEYEIRTGDTSLQDARHPGRAWFEVDAPVGEPSKWVTFFATRVLDWWSA